MININLYNKNLQNNSKILENSHEFELCSKKFLHKISQTLKWRKLIMSIVQDSISQIDSNDYSQGRIWRLEASRRALNFSELGLSEFYTIKNRETFQNSLENWNFAAVATLGGAYRILAKCHGSEPVQCKNIMKTLLTNLVIAYAPVYGRIDLDLEIDALSISPTCCRALILFVGTLAQGAIRQSRPDCPGGKISVELISGVISNLNIKFHLPFSQTNFLRTPEYGLACNLCGFFQSELCSTFRDDGSIFVSLEFPSAQNYLFKN